MDLVSPPRPGASVAQGADRTVVIEVDDDVPPKRPAHEAERDLYRAVLEYLEHNPHAVDTLDGIAEWWVMRQRIETSVTTLSRVLRMLVENGLVEELGPVERPRYRLRRNPGNRTGNEDER
jgi:hypothetical protein